MHASTKFCLPRLLFFFHPRHLTYAAISLRQDIFDVISQPLDTLAILHAVKEVLIIAPGAILEQRRLHHQLKMCLNVIDALHYQVGGRNHQV